MLKPLFKYASLYIFTLFGVCLYLYPTLANSQFFKIAESRNLFILNTIGMTSILAYSIFTVNDDFKNISRFFFAPVLIYLLFGIFVSFINVDTMYIISMINLVILFVIFSLTNYVNTIASDITTLVTLIFITVTRWPIILGWINRITTGSISLPPVILPIFFISLTAIVLKYKTILSKTNVQ